MRPFVRYLGRHHVGLLALFIALSGSAYAAGVARNSVGNAQLKHNAVTSDKVKDGSLQLSDFNASDRARLRGPAGAPGAAGATGATGLQGMQGPQGLPGALIDVISGPAGIDPATTPEVQTTPLTFTLPAAGKVDLGGSAEATGACPQGVDPCAWTSGLYLDGHPVPGSGFTTSVPGGLGTDDCDAGAQIGGFAQLAGVAAGRHTLTIGIKQVSGPAATVAPCTPSYEVTGPYQ